MAELIATRKAFGQELVNIGKEREDFVVMDADIAKSCSTDLFQKAFPERSYNFGIAEQNLMGIAAGFSSTGTKVFTATYSVFASMRACEQIRTFICYPGLDVKVIASHGGLQVGPDGATHQAIEDMAIMRSIPNMTFIQPSDAVSARKAARAIMDHNGPAYIRLLRNPSPIIHDESYNFEIGKAVEVRSFGTDCTIVSTGSMLFKAIEAADKLKEQGIMVKVMEIHTIKPIDIEAITKAAKDTNAIITVEDHNIYGGLGGAVAEVLSENYPTILKRIAVPDKFGESGPSEELYDMYGMGVENIIEAAKEIKNKK